MLQSEVLKKISPYFSWAQPEPSSPLVDAPVYKHQLEEVLLFCATLSTNNAKQRNNAFNANIAHGRQVQRTICRI